MKTVLVIAVVFCALCAAAVLAWEAVERRQHRKRNRHETR